MVAALMLLVACSSKVHENISEEMAKDTEQILDIMDSAIDEERDLTDRELSVFEQYLATYNAKLDNPDLAVGGLTEEEERLLIVTSMVIETPEIFMTLESDIERYESMKEQIKNVIKTGEI